MSIALGIDASLTATGLVAVPYDWGLDWSRVRRRTIGRKLAKTASLDDQLDRIAYIVFEVVEFCHEVKPTCAWIEEYAFSTMASRAHAIGELGGAVKLAIRELGIPLTAVPPASARKLLGKMPRKDVKDEVQVRLTRAGAPLEWKPDELDAFVVANWGLSGIKGADALILRTAEDDAKPKKQRRKAA